MASISRWSVLMRGGFLRGTADCFYVYTYVQRSPLTVCRNIWGWAAVAVGRLRSLYIQIQELHLKKNEEERGSQFFSYFISLHFIAGHCYLFFLLFVYCHNRGSTHWSSSLQKKELCIVHACRTVSVLFGWMEFHSW